MEGYVNLHTDVQTILESKGTMEVIIKVFNKDVLVELEYGQVKRA